MEEIIRDGLEQLGLTDTVPGNAAEQLAQYGRLLLEKNQVMNLTAIRDPEGVARLHMLDCAALLTFPGFQGETLIDVGTGAGFPGLVLKILRPELRVTLLDSQGKRVRWLQEVIETLRLSGVQAVQARAEEAAKGKPWREAFDLATARAVTEERALDELCLPFVRVGGSFLSMKAQDCTEERERANAAVKLLGARRENDVPYRIPGAGIKRRILIAKKVRPAPAEYPRPWGKIHRNPL